jgi:hypothetical protein
MSVERGRQKKQWVFLDANVEKEKEKNMQVLWWCNEGEDVANVLNVFFFFCVVVSEEGVGN